MDNLRTACLEKVKNEHEQYKKHFWDCGMDILGPDGDTYAAVREAKAVVENIVSDNDTTEETLNGILNTPKLIERIAAMYVRDPMTAFADSKKIAISIIVSYG